VDFDLGIYGLMNLATSLMDGFPPELVTCIGAQGAPDFGAWLTSLDNTQHYLLRRGTQSGTGHHSVLTHVNGDWYVIDTSSMTPIALTRNGQLLVENCRRLFTPDRGISWGRGFREYSILCAPVNAAILPDLNRHLRLQRLEQYENQLLYNHQRRNQIPPSEEPLRPSPFERLHSDQIALYNDGINFRRRFNCSAEYCLSALAFLLQSQVHFDLAHYGQINLPANLIDGLPAGAILRIGDQGAPDFSAWLTSLDNNQHYLVRRGAQAGLARHVVLTYANGDWYAIDASSITPIPLTQNGQLLLENCRLLFDPERGRRWGRGANNHHILYTPINVAALATLNAHLKEQRRRQQEERQQRQLGVEQTGASAAASATRPLASQAVREAFSLVNALLQTQNVLPGRPESRRNLMLHLHNAMNQQLLSAQPINLEQLRDFFLTPDAESGLSNLSLLQMLTAVLRASPHQEIRRQIEDILNSQSVGTVAIARLLDRTHRDFISGDEMLAMLEALPPAQANREMRSLTHAVLQVCRLALSELQLLQRNEAPV
ncbi:MAG: hypothetical protein ACRC9R_10120, partial [Enterovibrio sp.]